MSRHTRVLAVAAFLAHPALAVSQAVDSVAPRTAPGIVGRAHVDPRQDIAFQALAFPDTVYVGQQATYQVGVFLSDEIRARLRHNPEFVPPEVRSMLAFDLPSPPNAAVREIGTRRYDVHVFQRALFPLTAGRQVIPSARLNYALPLSNSFFAREESHSEASGAVVIVAREPPANGRPADYRGAVGRLTISTHVDGKGARVGDPFRFTVSVDGVGNVTLLPRPDLRISWADVVSGGERVQLDTTAVLLRGRKDFDWVVTPREAGGLSVPAVRYPYFNPYTERYEVAFSPPDSLTVGPGEIAAAHSASDDGEPVLPIRRIYRGEQPLPLPSHPGFWLVMALAPLPALAIASTRRPVARKAAPSHVATLRALASAGGPVDPGALRRAYAATIASRVVTTSAAMSSHVELVRVLRHAGVSERTAHEAERLLAELDAVVFGQSGPLAPGTERRAYDLVRAVDLEARARPDLAVRAARLSMLLLVVVGAGAVAAEVDAVSARIFSEGVRQYDARQFADARGSFFELARARPRAADAWMNFGTASWLAHDTAAAVVGWQRAARLQPTAADVRRGLALAPGFRDGWLGDIPPVSLTTLALAGGLAWLAGWGLITLRLRRRHPRPLRVGAGAIAVAGLCLVAGLVQRDTLDGRNAAVVVSAAQLRNGPALGAETGAETIAGESVQIIGRQGVWTRVRLSDGRRGWVESQRVQSVGVE